MTPIPVLISELYIPYREHFCAAMDKAIEINGGRFHHPLTPRVRGVTAFTAPSPEAFAYITKAQTVYEPIRREWEQVLSWVNRVSNKLYCRDHFRSILPAQFHEGEFTCGEHDRRILDAAKKDPELLLLKKRLLLRSML